MLINRALEPARSAGALPGGDSLTRQMDAMVGEGGREGPSRPKQDEPRGAGMFGTMANASGEALRTMSIDPVSAARQTFGAVRRHPYMTAVLLLLFGAALAGLARS